MALKIFGIILILVGCTGLYEAAQAVKQGSITRFDSENKYPIKRDDPDFDKEVSVRRIGGLTSIGIGIACLLIRKGDKDETE